MSRITKIWIGADDEIEALFFEVYDAADTLCLHTDCWTIHLPLSDSVVNKLFPANHKKANIACKSQDTARC